MNSLKINKNKEINSFNIIINKNVLSDSAKIKKYNNESNETIENLSQKENKKEENFDKIHNLKNMNQLNTKNTDPILYDDNKKFTFSVDDYKDSSNGSGKKCVEIQESFIAHGKKLNFNLII